MLVFKLNVNVQFINTRSNDVLYNTEPFIVYHRQWKQSKLIKHKIVWENFAEKYITVRFTQALSSLY